jgi:transposase
MARFWLRDDQFERIEALPPGKRNDPGRTAANNRLFVEAVLWIARTGNPWRDLPQEFGLWNSAYQRFARWARQGVWHRIFAKVAGDADFEEVFIDSTIVRAHQHAAGAAKKRRSGTRTFPRRPEYKDSCRGRRFGFSGSIPADGRRSR